MSTVSIMVVDHNRLMLEGITRLMEDVSEFHVVAAVEDGIVAMEQVKRQQPDVVLMDMQLPRQGGLETCKLITRKYPLTRVVMLTSDHNDLYLFEAIRAGARGYLRKSISAQELVKAIHTVYREGAILPPFAAQQVMHRMSCSHSYDAEPLQELTPKEREILSLVVEGQTTHQIAEFLFISPKTVRNHLSNIYKRLGTRDRLQTILYMTEKTAKSSA